MERHRTLAIELENREKPRDNNPALMNTRNQTAEAGFPAAQNAQHLNGLLPHAHQRCVKMLGGHHGKGLRGKGEHRQRLEILQARGPLQGRCLISVMLV